MLPDKLTLNSSINVNDPGLISLVNKLQDVFTTVGVSGPQDQGCSYTLSAGG